MENIEKIDALTMQNFALKIKALRLELSLLIAQEKEFHEEITEKYKLDPQDSVDLESLKIIRAKKAE